jgi:hypothetical protein
MGRVDRPVGPQPAHGPRRPDRLVSLLHPRPRRQVHSHVRRDLRRRGREDGQDSAADAAGQLLCRAVGAHRTVRVHRPDADLQRTAPADGARNVRRPLQRPVRAENHVTATDLVCRAIGSAVWLREQLSFGHCQYPCHYDSAIWRCSACWAGSPCSPAPTTPKTPRSSSCATKSPCSSARQRHRGCPGPTGRSWLRWPGSCPASTSASYP